MEKIQGFIGSVSQKSVIKKWFEERNSWNFWEYSFDSEEMFYFIGGFNRIEAVMVDDRNFIKWKEEGRVDILSSEKENKVSHMFQFLEDVLVRSYDTDLTWCHGQITHVIFETNSNECRYIVSGGLCFTECIPFKGNEELLGTELAPSEEYQYNFERGSIKIFYR